jgi:hypothetical protein
MKRLLMCCLLQRERCMRKKAKVTPLMAKDLADIPGHRGHDDHGRK